MPMDGRLYKAAKSGDMSVLREYRDQFTTQLTPYKDTVLHIAAYCTNFSSKDAGKFLAIVGPDLLFCLNSNTDTCIHVAARKGHVNLIKALIGYMKQNCPAGLEGGIEPIHKLLRIPNNKGNMALHEAVMHRRHEVVEMLVREDADFTYPPNHAFKSPLFLAMEKEDKASGEWILSNSRSPSYEGPHGTTALHAAALIRYGAYECLEMILKKEPSLITQVDDEGWSALHFAAFLGSQMTVKVLLKEDKQMAYETIKEDNKTPLHLAALNGRFPAVKEIIEQCPYFNANDLRYANQSIDPSVVIHHPYLEQTDLWLQVTYPDYNTEQTNLWLQGKDVKNKFAEDKERVNTNLVVATLIMTIAFTCGFTIPGGYDDEEGPNNGMANLATKTAFKAFVVADTIAMIYSTSAVLLHFTATLKQGTMTYTCYILAARYILIAMLAMVIAFTTGLYVVLPSKGLAIGVCVLCYKPLYLLINAFDVERFACKIRVYFELVRLGSREERNQHV